MSQVATLRRELLSRDVVLKPYQLFDVIDKNSHCVYNERKRCSGIIATAFLETISHYRQSPLVGAKFAVTVLEEMLTRIEQDIANNI
jgi:hypothetical protein